MRLCFAQIREGRKALLHSPSLLRDTHFFLTIYYSQGLKCKYKYKYAQKPYKCMLEEISNSTE